MANYKRRSKRRETNKLYIFPCGCCSEPRGGKVERKAPIEDGPCTGRVAKKGKWCKGHVGVEHKPVFRMRTYYGYHYYGGYYCERCGKTLWGYRPPERPVEKVSDHWSQWNIKLRLAGYPCGCASCKASVV